MVRVETIARTSNVVSIKGVLFSAVGNKIKMLPIEFSKSDAIIHNCSAGQYYLYKNNSNIDSWGQGIATIDKQIDIVEPYNNGAKYIYVLSTGFLPHDSQTISALIGPLSFVKNLNGVWSKFDIKPIVIKYHATDYNVANKNSFDNKILECYYPIASAINNNYTAAVVSYCEEAGPYTAFESTPYTFSNTIIDKPIAYFI